MSEAISEFFTSVDVGSLEFEDLMNYQIDRHVTPLPQEVSEFARLSAKTLFSIYSKRSFTFGYKGGYFILVVLHTLEGPKGWYKLFDMLDAKFDYVSEKKITTHSQIYKGQKVLTPRLDFNGKPIHAMGGFSGQTVRLYVKEKKGGFPGSILVVNDYE